ncbi:MAG: amino acid ABC transporter permease [Atopobiaceae bacterium]|jgi:putative lysine transport system permease protein|nr:amino acid ABC transporter permease [Atopobium sp.]MCH4082404.1 amino acid ABC transporter permease [Atopobiaceae bacterium]MCI1344310.1 amino acid ABC transporter permease [Atopobiaceae bacterium]MCI1498529.1 amino acid ABC transporter permease [Atopobiaceae bacterium]MCI1540240.1 amino acid ABC transporter permease [Atopobiaceae bacterium]
MAKKRGFARFVREDHRYVFLGTSAIACVGLVLANQPHSPSSFLLRSYAVESILYYVLLAWLAVSAVALVNKLAKWRGTAYAETSPFTKPEAKKAERICSYIVWAIVGIFFVDRGIIGLSDLLSSSISSDSNPTDFLASMFYMLYQMRDTFIQGILGTIEIAVIGTVVAFFLSLGLVFLRLMEIDRSDNDFVRFWKVVGVGFAKVYSAVMRGTPMMIQGLIIYYAGTGLLTGQGMTPTQILQVWSPFNAGLVTVSLNSTAYMMEVLRSGIMAVDPGQTEAARSLGMSQWQAMRKVVFPQGIKNAIPALSNELVINIKDSSVLMAIGVLELTFAVRTIAGVYFKQMEPYIAAAVVYLILTMIATKLLNKFGEHFDAKGERVVLGTSDVPVAKPQGGDEK